MMADTEMSAHIELDDLAVYALGFAEAPLRVHIEAHVERCPVCRNELQRIYSDMGVLALAAPEAEPAPSVRSRLMTSIARQTARPAEAIQPRRGRRENWWWLVAPVIASLVLAVLAGTLVRRNQTLNAEIQSVRQQTAATRTQAEAAEQVIATIHASDAQRITLVKAQSKVQPQLQTIYSRQQRRILLVANDLEQLKPGKAYELWLLPAAADQAPVAAGVFHPDSKGNAYHTYALPLDIKAKGFAITVENDGGSQAPTSTPIFVGLQS
jgi:anti-sigma-K factor RskA